MSRSALVGYTGFVGGTLHRARSFDVLINSKNADDLRGGDFDLVIHAGVPAVKWIANKDPAADRAAIDFDLRRTGDDEGQGIDPDLDHRRLS